MNPLASHRIPYDIPGVHAQELISLGFESTSHTFGVGIVRLRGGAVEVLANVNSQYKPPKGGLHPREASYHHMEKAYSLLKQALEKAGVSLKDVSVVSYSMGPGLGPCLRVSASVARFLASYYDKPLVPVNHAIAHIEIGKLYSGFTDPLVIYVSGGNTMIVVAKDGAYRVLGETLDIPLGNLLDTFAREIGIAPPYVVEGKHAVDLCSEWNPDFVPLPYTVKGSDLSFSGLLTAALQRARNARGDRRTLGAICNSLRETAFNMLVEVAERSLILSGKKSILLVGGVASNTVLKWKLEKLSEIHGIPYYGTPPDIAGDNGLMISYTGLLMYLNGFSVKPEEAFVRQRLRLDEGSYPWLGL
ncbi:MAG: KEOPS complex N(6)-L-threonylcarbamoyladenine synthase Kae1 [Thermosphaera sp.]